MDNKTKKLMNNTILFMIGSIGSKFIQFLLVPLYTYTLSTNDYGTTDIIFTTINFLIPFFSIQISDGMLRFGLDKKINKESVINCSFKILIIGSLVSIILTPVFSISSTLKNWLFYFLILLNLRMYRDLFAIILKIEDKNKLYAIDSILYTLVLCISSFVSLALLGLGIQGYFLSYVIANVFSIIFIIIIAKINIKNIKNKTNKVLLKKIILYSLPLVVNSISYWITTAFDRYMISWMLDNESVGLYAVATKIPTILTTFTGIFSQAWLISSINEFENDKDNKFYSQTFLNYNQLSFIVCAIIILVTYPFMKVYVNAAYLKSWVFVPVLTISAIFSGICSFLNGIYYAYKKNVSTTITTIVGAVINIILNFILIPYFGIMGASIATLISWVIIVLLKIIFMKKFITININKNYLLLSFFLLLLEMIILLCIDSFIIKYLLNIFIVILIIYINHDIIKKVNNIIKSKLKRGIKK